MQGTVQQVPAGESVRWFEATGAGERAEPAGAVRRAIVEQAVALAFDVPVGELRAPTRRRAPVAFARQVAMYMAHVAYGLSLTEVGVLFGRDRTTVAHACSLVEDRRDEPGFDRSLDHLEAAIATLSRISLALDAGGKGDG